MDVTNTNINAFDWYCSRRNKRERDRNENKSRNISFLVPT